VEIDLLITHIHNHPHSAGISLPLLSVVLEGPILGEQGHYDLLDLVCAGFYERVLDIRLPCWDLNGGCRWSCGSRRFVLAGACPFRMGFAHGPNMYNSMDLHFGSDNETKRIQILCKQLMDFFFLWGHTDSKMATV
jgi:hypothetical protein